MRKDHFTDEALAAAKALARLDYAEEASAEALDFARCQRPDGSFYPIPDGKKCRKGTEASSAGLEANRLRQQLAALKAERREPGKTKVANSAPKKSAIKTNFRKDIETGAKIRRERDAAIEKLQGRQMRLRKAYAKANQDAAAAIRAKDPARAEKAKARVAKLGEALDSANDMMRKYTGNRGNTGGRTPNKLEKGG